jgi:hypothetical protein
MNKKCEVNVAPMANGDDDPRYMECGKPAHFKVGDTSMCTGLYDEMDHGQQEPEDDALDSIE